MILTTRDALKQTRLISDDEIYRAVKLPAGAITVAAGILAEVGSPFTALIVDEQEVSLFIPDEAVEEFGGRLKAAEISQVRYRLITFDVQLPPTLVGFMAAVSTVLAREGISILPFGAYQRDHILVDEAQYDAAVAALNELIGQA
jgi:hypothetical protein